MPNKELELKKRVFSAISNRDFEFVRNFLAENARKDNIKRMDLNSEITPLSWAVICNDTDMIKMLLRDAAANDIDVNAIDSSGCTALMLAVAQGNKNVVQVLAEEGVRLGIDPNITDRDETTAFMLAQAYDDDMYDILIEHADVKLRSHNRKRTEAENRKTLSDTRKHIAGIKAGFNSDMTPLMWAVINGHRYKVRELLNGAPENGVDVNAINQEGFSALLFAVAKGRKDIAKLFLDKKRELQLDLNIKANDGCDLLTLARALDDNGELYHELTENGAEILESHDKRTDEENKNFLSAVKMYMEGASAFFDDYDSEIAPP
jgi:ankyrin repeat protein